jgi:hypothetical protein
MEKVTKEMREALRMPLPVGAVTKHPTKTFLSSIKAIYVTERLNDVFGVGSWQIKVNHVTTTDKSMVVVKVEFSIPEYGIYFECYGGNDNGGENSRNFDLGDAYKGATTDALTKIGSYLEIGIDVFKGLQTRTPTTTPPPTTNTELKWLNVLDKDKNFTKEWANILEAIQNNKIERIEQVEKHYKLSKEVKDKLLTILNK